MKREIFVEIDGALLEEILECAKTLYPREVILILRGNVKREAKTRYISIIDYIIPPQAIYGSSFSGFNPYMLPLDSKIVGLMHSHPSGSPNPSVTDLNQMAGIFAMIAAYPYKGAEDVKIFDQQGTSQTLVVRSPF